MAIKIIDKVEPFEIVLEDGSPDPSKVFCRPLLDEDMFEFHHEFTKLFDALSNDGETVAMLSKVDFQFVNQVLERVYVRGEGFLDADGNPVPDLPVSVLLTQSVGLRIGIIVKVIEKSQDQLGNSLSTLSLGVVQGNPVQGAGQTPNNSENSSGSINGQTVEHAKNRYPKEETGSSSYLDGTSGCFP